MKTIKDFTPEIQSKIPAYKERALEGVSDGGRYNNFSLEKAIKCIEWSYKQIAKKAPLVIVAENPYEMTLMFNFIKQLARISILRLDGAKCVVPKRTSIYRDWEEAEEDGYTCKKVTINVVNE